MDACAESPPGLPRTSPNRVSAERLEKPTRGIRALRARLHVARSGYGTENSGWFGGGPPKAPVAGSKMNLETWELMSYVVTVVGLPLAILVFLYEQKKERENEEEEVYQLLSDNYQEFLRIALEHPDLHLYTKEFTPELSGEQRERMLILFSMLISLFERSYLLLYEEGMVPKKARRWSSWEDYMVEWCERDDFRQLLPELLRGEDPEFVSYIRALEARAAAAIER